MFLYFSKANSSLLGNFLISSMISTLKNKLLYSLSTFNNNSSSLSFNALLILVIIFCISVFNFSLFSFISSYILFISLKYSLNLFDNSSNNLIFPFILFYFSFLLLFHLYNIYHNQNVVHLLYL